MLNHLTSIWRNDSTLRRVVKNSGHLLSGNVFAAALGFVQGIFAFRLVGATDWGLVTTVITFASNINRLLTFRMNEIVVQRLGGVVPVPEYHPESLTGRGAALENGKKVEAAAAGKAAMLTEAGTSVAA